jgi:GNAT superfamily N-acetyltransferase
MSVGLQEGFMAGPADTILVGVAAGDDVPELEALFREAIVARYPADRGQPDWRADFPGWIASPEYTVFTARKAGTLVGFAVAKAERVEDQDFMAAPMCELVYLAVAQPVRASGVGTALYEEVLGWCRDEGLPRIRAVAHAWEPELMRFLERRGHQPTVVITDLNKLPR